MSDGTLVGGVKGARLCATSRSERRRATALRRTSQRRVQRERERRERGPGSRWWRCKEEERRRRHDAPLSLHLPLARDGGVAFGSGTCKTNEVWWVLVVLGCLGAGGGRGYCIDCVWDSMSGVSIEAWVMYVFYFFVSYCFAVVTAIGRVYKV